MPVLPNVSGEISDFFISDNMLHSRLQNTVKPRFNVPGFGDDFFMSRQ
jgi:hypothetical protein